MLRLLALTLSFSFLAGHTLAQPPALKPKRLALLIGVNQYKYHTNFQDLKGCVNDVKRFADLLTTKYGFATADVKVLTDAQATHDGIVNAFRSHLVSRASAGDTVVFYYAGHGSRAPDPSEPSGFEQTIVPSDSRDPAGKVFDITDKELRALFGELRQKTSEITAIMDSCHSGTAIRGGRQRTIPADTRPQPVRTATRGGNQASDGDRGIVYLAGSRAEQSSYEHHADLADHGAMSYFLARVLSTADPEMTWRDVMDRVRTLVTAAYPMQDPQLEGSAADKLVFGEAASTSQPYYLASPAEDGVKLNAGRVHGLTAGSSFDVFAPGTKKFDGDAKPVAKLELTSVATFSSEAKIVSGGPVPVGARAVERARKYEDFKLSVYLDPAIPADTAALLKPLLAGNPQLKMVATPAECALQIGVSGDKLTTQAADGSPLSPPTALNDPALLTTIGRQLTAWAKWFNLMMIDNPAAPPMVTLTLEPQKPRPDGKIRHGDKLTARVLNRSTQEVFFNIIDISSDGSVGLVNPKPGGTVVSLAAGMTETWSIDVNVPAGRDSVRDTFKVFATDTPVDFRPLTSGAIRDVSAGPPTPLGSLLANAATGSRGATTSVSLTDWSTASKSIVIEKQAEQQ